MTIGSSQTLVSGPGNDTVTGANGHGGYGLWFATQRPVVDLAQGVATNDGFGNRDRLSGIDTVHLPAMGGAVRGSSAAETVFVFGGPNTIDLGGGNDAVRYYQRNSTGYEISASGGVVQVKDKQTGAVDMLRNVEQLQFDDRTIATAYLTAALKAATQYVAYSFTETQMAPAYTYAGVTYPAALLSWFPQAVFQLDVNCDGTQDVIVPMNKGYASELDARTPFLALTTTSAGKLTLPATNAQMPVTAGARRAAPIQLASEGKQAVVTVARAPTCWWAFRSRPRTRPT